MIDHCSGNFYIVAAPSGGGKTSLVKKLVESLKNIEVSVSHTTRLKRPGEREGVDYYFVSPEEFGDLVEENAFIEHAIVFDKEYGTSFNQIQSRLSEGIDVVLDIDWQGARQICNLFPDAVSIFIVPPSLEILKQRLLARKRDDENTIEQRMKLAQNEMQHCSEFDYLIVNDDFELAAQELQSIVIANRLRYSKQRINQAKLLSFLLSAK